MNSFKSFVKNIADKAPDFASPTKSTSGGVDDGATPFPEDGAEGFICPICMSGFTNPDDLQVHFERDHSDENGSQGNSIKDEVKQLQVTLKEEQSYSAELKREVERLSTDVQSSSLEEDEEKFLLTSQLEALQMGKDVLQREVESLTKALAASEAHANGHDDLMDGLKAKLSSLTTENVTLKAELDEACSEKKVALEKSKVLESVLEQQNNSDDVAVLRNELHNVQKLMMNDIQEIKTDSKIEDVRIENAKLLSHIEALNSDKLQLERSVDKMEQEVKSRVSELESQVTKKETEKQAEIEQSNAVVQELNVGKSQLEEKMKIVKEESTHLAAQLEQKSVAIQDLELAITDLREKLNTYSKLQDDLKTQLCEKNSSLDEVMRHKTNFENQLSSSASEIENLKGELQRAKDEKQDLLSNIEAKEGINTALQQLKVENESMTSQLQSLVEEKQALVEEHRTEVDQLYATISEGKSKLSTANDKVSKLELFVKDLEGKTASSSTEKSKLEAQIASKVKQISELETNQKSMTTLFDNDRTEHKAKLSSKEEELEHLTKTIGEMTSCIHKIKEEKEEVEEQLGKNQLLFETEAKKAESLISECSKLKSDVSSLKSDLASKSYALQSYDKQVAQLTEKLRETETQSSQKMSELEALARSLKEDISGFKEATLNQSQTISTLQEDLEKERERSTAFEAKSVKLEEEKRQNSEDMTRIVSSLESEKKDLLTDLNSKTVLLEKLLLKNGELEAKLSKLSDQLANTNFEVTKLEEKSEKTEATFGKQILELEETIDDLTKGKDLLLSGKVELQSKLEDREKTAVKLQKQIDTEKRKVADAVTVMETKLKEAENQMGDLLDNHQSEIAKVQQECAKLKEAVETLAVEKKEFTKKSDKHQSELKALNDQLESVIGERLELEAKVGSSADEIRSLLERCLAAERELDRSKSSVVELRRKLDDSQAALHELGRENQSIQVELAKQTGRKWADDAETTECLACKTGFSITNRKHHCRNCGQIFCNECSSKQTTMSNYKKAQRVCDPCYAELQLPGAQSRG